jgi:hypothetical protein
MSLEVQVDVFFRWEKMCSWALDLVTPIQCIRRHIRATSAAYHLMRLLPNGQSPRLASKRQGKPRDADIMPVMLDCSASIYVEVTWICEKSPLTYTASSQDNDCGREQAYG